MNTEQKSIVELIIPIYENELTEFDLEISSGRIVRCKDCAYWRRLMLNSDGDGVCRCDNVLCGHVTTQDWFCKDGVKGDKCDRL